MQDFDRPALIGVIYDLSLAHSADGRRNIDIVKDCLVQQMIRLGPETRMYVSHPKWQTIPRDQGESTFFVVSYQEPPGFRIEYAFKDAIGIVGLHKEECEKYVFLVTDRFQAPNNYHYRKGFILNEIRGYGCKICVFGIGNQYDKITLKSLAEDNNAVFVHLDDSSLLAEQVTKIMGE